MDLSALVAARKRERPRTLLGQAVRPVAAHQAGAQQVARVGGSEAIMFGGAETPQCAAQSPEFAERCDAVALFC